MSSSTASLSPGTHTIYFKVLDDKGAWSSEASSTLIVNEAPKISTSIIVEDVSGKPGEKVRLTAILQDSSGNYLSDKKLFFYVEGYYTGWAITKNGKAEIEYVIPSGWAGKKKITVVFEGDSSYQKGEGYGTLAIKEKHVIINVFDKSNGENLRGVEVYTIINNIKEYKGNTDASGNAKIEIKNYPVLISVYKSGYTSERIEIIQPHEGRTIRIGIKKVKSICLRYSLPSPSADWYIVVGGGAIDARDIDWDTACKFYDYLSDAGFNVDVVSGRSSKSELAGRNLILIGGYLANRVTNDIKQKQPKITSYGSGQLVVYPNPYNSNKKVILVSGDTGSDTEFLGNFLIGIMRDSRKSPTDAIYTILSQGRKEPSIEHSIEVTKSDIPPDELLGFIGEMGFEGVKMFTIGSCIDEGVMTVGCGFDVITTGADVIAIISPFEGPGGEIIITGAKGAKFLDKLKDAFKAGRVSKPLTKLIKYADEVELAVKSDGSWTKITLKNADLKELKRLGILTEDGNKLGGFPRMVEYYSKSGITNTKKVLSLSNNNLKIEEFLKAADKFTVQRKTKLFKFNEETFNHVVKRDHFKQIMDEWALKDTNEILNLLDEGIKKGKYIGPGREIYRGEEYAKYGYFVYDYTKANKKLRIVLDEVNDMIVTVYPL